MHSLLPNNRGASDFKGFFIKPADQLLVLLVDAGSAKLSVSVFFRLRKSMHDRELSSWLFWNLGLIVVSDWGSSLIGDSFGFLLDSENTGESMVPQATDDDDVDVVDVCDICRIKTGFWSIVLAVSSDSSEGNSRSG
jgi:hypothetical protein